MQPQEASLYNLRTDTDYGIEPEGSCAVSNDKQTLLPKGARQSPESLITCIDNIECWGNRSHKHADIDSLITDASELRTRSRQCFEYAHSWRNVTTQDSINTLVLVQDLPHCELGVLKSFDFLDDGESCPNPQINRSVKPALANILTQSGQEHISGFSDDEGMFHGLKVVPYSVSKVAFNQYLP